MHKQKGSSLVGVMVSLSILGVIGVASSQAIAQLINTKERTRSMSVSNSTVQVASQQLTADLQAAEQSIGIKPITWDGKTLMMVRRDSISDRLVVVAWTVKDVAGEGRKLLRWISAPMHTTGSMEAAWAEGSMWGRSPVVGTASVLISASKFSVQSWNYNSWTNAQSSNSVANPRGLRMLIDTPQGTLTKDWLNPLNTDRKS